MAQIIERRTAAAVAAVAVSFAMYVAAFEPFGCAEFAYVFAVPAILACRFLCGANEDLKAIVPEQNRPKYFDDEYAREIEKYGMSAPCIACAYESEKIRKRTDTENEKKLQRNRKRIWLVSTFFCSWAAWAAILIWLRHVYPPAGYLAVFLLPLVVGGGFVFPWFALLPRLLPNLGDSVFSRLFSLLGIAGFWVALEWLRSWIFTGFPWLLLAHSQWMRPAAVQTAEFGGVWIVSFGIVFFNLAIAEYIYRIYVRQKFKIANRFEKISPISKISPEFYLAVLMVVSGVWLYILNLPRTENERVEFRAGMIQPDFAGILKWNDSLAEQNIETVINLTKGLKDSSVDVILWPEAATPPRYPIIGTPQMKAIIEGLAKSQNTPLLIGNMAYSFEDKAAQNGAFAVDPERGLNPNFYAKRKLVPFGEYVPSWCGFLGKVVPVGNMKPGLNDKPLNVEIKGKKYKVGAMICYEDIFPELGRKMAANGADMLYVCTNDSWYGREGGAWQHAAHSALQAVATRKPLLRSSNNGLTTVFDQYGRMSVFNTLTDASQKAWDGAPGTSPSPTLDIRNESGRQIDSRTLRPKRASPMLDENSSIYFRGAGFSDVVFYKNFDGVETFYVRYGNWFAYLSVILAFYAIVLKCRKKA